MRLLASCPFVFVSVRTELDSHRTDFDKIGDLSSFLKICWENRSFIKIWQEQRVLYMNTYSHLWQYLAEFFLEWELFWAKFVGENQTTYSMFSKLFSENRAVYDVMSKILGEFTNDVIIWHICVAWWISKSTAVHAHAHAHPRKRTHSRASTHRQICNTAFPQQQKFTKTPQCYDVRTLTVLFSPVDTASCCKKTH